MPCDPLFADVSAEELCKMYDENSRVAFLSLRRALGFLPELAARGVPLERGFKSVEAMAVRDGHSVNSVKVLFKLHKRFEDCPKLRGLLVASETCLTRLDAVSRLAKPGEDEELASYVTDWPTPVLRAYVKSRLEQGDGGDGDEARCDTLSEAILESAAPRRPLYLSPGTHEVVKKAVAMVCKDAGAGLSTDRALRIALRSVHPKYRIPADGIIVSRHEGAGVHTLGTPAGPIILGKETLEEFTENATVVDLAEARREAMEAIAKEPEAVYETQGKKASRHIPEAVDRYLLYKWAGRCAYPRCHCEADDRHHVNRFAVSGRHHPDDIVPLCSAHHGLAHAGLIENEFDSPERWRAGPRPAPRTAEEAARARVDEQWARMRSKGRAARSGASRGGDPGGSKGFGASSGGGARGECSGGAASGGTSMGGSDPP